MKRKLATRSNASLGYVGTPLIWQNHRWALSPLNASELTPNIQSEAKRLQDVDGLERVDFLVHNGLAAWWADRLTGELALYNMPNDVSETLVAARRTAGVIYMMQSAALSQITTVLESENIIYAVLKGVATREETYPLPALRSACDIDSVNGAGGCRPFRSSIAWAMPFAGRSSWRRP